MGLPFLLTIPVTFLGVVLLPRRYSIAIVFLTKGRVDSEPDDPNHLARSVAILSAVATPFILYFVGPYAVLALISAGFVWNAG